MELGAGEDRLAYNLLYQAPSGTGRALAGPPNKRLELSSAKHRKRARRARKVTCHSPKTGFKTADVIGPKKAPGRPGYMLHHRKPAPGSPGAVWGGLIRKRANLDARRAPDRRLSAQNVTCHQGPKLGPSERGYMQITEFEPLSHHRKLPNLGLHRMRDTKRLFGGPVTSRPRHRH